MSGNVTAICLSISDAAAATWQRSGSISREAIALHRINLISEAARATATSQFTVSAVAPSGSSVLCDMLDFFDETGLHVENKPPHRNFFGDPGM